jgi:hypothetical protein
MEPITITRGDEILAHHTIESCLSHYGQPMWVVEDEDPEPGPALWQQGTNQLPLEILGVHGGWLICRQPDDFLCGVIWSDGGYYAALIEDQNGQALTELITGAKIRGTVQLDPSSGEDLGAIF